jgi:hypothetical protein
MDRVAVTDSADRMKQGRENRVRELQRREAVAHFDQAMM